MQGFPWWLLTHTPSGVVTVAGLSAKNDAHINEEHQYADPQTDGRWEYCLLFEKHPHPHERDCCANESADKPDHHKSSSWNCSSRFELPNGKNCPNSSGCRWGFEPSQEALRSSPHSTRVPILLSWGGKRYLHNVGKTVILYHLRLDCSCNYGRHRLWETCRLRRTGLRRRVDVCNEHTWWKIAYVLCVQLLHPRTT